MRYKVTFNYDVEFFLGTGNPFGDVYNHFRLFNSLAEAVGYGEEIRKEAMLRKVDSAVDRSLKLAARNNMIVTLKSEDGKDCYFVRPTDMIYYTEQAAITAKIRAICAEAVADATKELAEETHHFYKITEIATLDNRGKFL